MVEERPFRFRAVVRVALNQGAFSLVTKRLFLKHAVGYRIKSLPLILAWQIANCYLLIAICYFPASISGKTLPGNPISLSEDYIQDNSKTWYYRLGVVKYCSLSTDGR
jgi:hypothetical protein